MNTQRLHLQAKQTQSSSPQMLRLKSEELQAQHEQKTGHDARQIVHLSAASSTGMALARKSLYQIVGSALQTKLTLGPVGDQYEQEADRVASQVVTQINTPAPQQSPLQRQGGPEEEELQMKPVAVRLQRDELPEEEVMTKPTAERLQRGALPEEELQMKPSIQRNAIMEGGPVGDDVESTIQSARGGGQSLPDSTMASMGNAFNADFSGVRVHTDSQSDSLNQTLQARAFTTGQDIFFRQGEYNPGSRQGQELLAHELTHVVQQNGAAVQREESLQPKRISAEQRSKNSSVENDSLARTSFSQIITRSINKALHTIPSTIRSSSTSSHIQRYIENDADLAPGKVSEGGQIAMVDSKQVFATAAKIEEANNALAATPARVTLAAGEAFAKPNAEAWQTRFGANPRLLRVMPVFKANTLSAEKAKTEPVAGDSVIESAKKLQVYKDSLTLKLRSINQLAEEFQIRWRQLEAKRQTPLIGAFYASTGLPTEIWAEFNGRINNLIKDTMGPMWATEPAALAIFLPQGDERNKLTLGQHLKLFQVLYQEYLAKFSNELAPEIDMRELWMTLPNDCKNAAMILTGKDETALNQSSDNPGVGSNYSLAFGAEMNYGWATHYATVIMKDQKDANMDNLSFETAASINAGMQDGKSLGFFEMYGTANPVQTFVYTSWRKNRENVKQQAKVDMDQAKTEIAKQKVKQDMEADLARIDLKLATLTPLPEDVEEL